MSEVANEASRRRTFAIISHPDAGKTTLTEKLLLFGGAIQMAGSVKGRKAARHATSDWMALEKERGISVTSSVMQFPYEGKIVNLLDTPGHADFGEDTYRVLTAVDSALMVIDVAKGVEERTIKLMEVCRLRDTPIMTFINKLDREGKDPIELLDEVETVLGIQCAPVTWPIGMGQRLKGVVHLLTGEVHLYEPGRNFTRQDSTIFPSIDAPGLAEKIGAQMLADLRDELELVQGASHPFDLDAYRAGKQTPVFFGSGVNNFGVQPLLDFFVEHAPSPQARSTTGREIAPEENKLTGFVFKIQANMDPQHRRLGRQQQWQVGGAVGVGDIDIAVAALAQHAHLLFVVAVAGRADAAQPWANLGADHRYVLVGDESQDRPCQLWRRAGGNHHAVALGAVRGEHLQRLRQQLGAHLRLIAQHIGVDDLVEVARTVQAEAADPHIDRNTGTTGRQQRHHRPGDRRDQQRRQHPQRVALDQRGEQMGARIAVVEGVVEIEDHQRRIVARRRIVRFHAAKNS